jgi:cell division protein FtsA
MALRIEEILELIAREVERAGLLNRLRAGVFLAGGGTRVARIQNAAEAIFGLPVYVGKASTLNGQRSALEQPEFATAIGLVKFGSFQSRRRGGRQSLAEGLRNRFGALLKVVRR